MRLLIASDGSPHSDAALRLGAQLLQRRRPTQSSTAQPPTVVTVIRRENDQPQAKQTLAKALALLGMKANEVTTKIRIGRPAEEIVGETIEGKYHLVILGKSSEQSRFTRWLGLTTVQVAEHAPCSVAIATGEIKPIRQVLVCDSGVHSPSLLNRFMQQVGDLLEEGVIITVLHVMSQMAAGPSVSGEQLRANTEELIQEHAPEGELLTQDIRVLQKANIQAVPKVRHGFVVDEILDEAHRGNYDLVVIGAHEKARWTGFLLDDLAKQIITQIDRPVLLVR
jgi:nucleotide-binding universal stress UspA family protein